MPGPTIAAMVRAKYPGAYDDLSDAELETKVKAKYPGAYDDLPTSLVAGPHPEAKIGAQPPEGFGERMLAAVGPTIRGVGDVFMANRILEGMGVVEPGRLTGDEANPRDAATRTGAEVAGSVPMITAAVSGVIAAGRAGGVPAVIKHVATMQVAPQVKYEITKQALGYLHLPDAVAIPVAILVSGGGGGKGASKTTGTTTRTPSPAVADTAASVSMEEATRAAQAARATAFETPRPGAPAPATATPAAPVTSPPPQAPVVAPAAATSASPTKAATPVPLDLAVNAVHKLAHADGMAVPAQDFSDLATLVREGHEPAEVWQHYKAHRAAAELQTKLGTPTEAEMKADMRQRAESGQKTLMPVYGSQSNPPGKP